MTKIEYLKQLENELRYKISEQEMYDIMRDYAEYFEEGKKQGKTDKQIIEALGIPYVVAKQILGENPDNVNEAIKKGTANLKSSFDSVKKSAQTKYEQHKAKSEEKKKIKEELNQRPRPVRQRQDREKGAIVGILSAILKVALWVFLFIPLIVSLGATGIACVIGSIVGIGFLSAFSFTVSTYTIFAASLILLCLLFGGLTIIFGLIWFIKYLLGLSDIKQQCAYAGANPHMNNFNYQHNPNCNQNAPQETNKNDDKTEEKETNPPQQETQDKDNLEKKTQPFEVNIKDESILEDTADASNETDIKEEK